MTTTTTPAKQETLLELAQALIPRAQVLEILLTSAKVRRDTSVEISEEISLSYNFRIAIACNEDSSACRVRVTFTLSGSNEQPDESGRDEVFNIEAEFTLFYKFSTFEGMEKKHVEAFGRLNGVFNAWPYWREFVQSSLSRLSLPPVTVPLLTVSGLQKIYEEQGSKNTEEAPLKQTAPD